MTHVPTHRRTLSGKLIPRGVQVLPTWQEIVRPPKRQRPRERNSAWYKAMRAVPTPTAVVEFPEGYRGERANRPYGAYSRGLRVRLGLAWSQRIARSHPVRRRNTAAEALARRIRKAARAQVREEAKAA